MKITNGYEAKKMYGDIMHDYIKRTMPTGSFDYGTASEREMTQAEKELALEIRHLWRQMGVQIIELIMIRDIIRFHSDKRLKYVDGNVNRINFSLVRQRKLLDIIKIRYVYFRPDKNEEKSIKIFIQDIRDRMDRIEKVILPENIELTPLKEYIDLIGGWDAFTKEIRTSFYSKIDEMFTENGNTREPLKDYIESVLNIVSKNGLNEAYRERLEKYLAIEEIRQQKKKEELLKEKNDYEHNEAEHGLMQFSRMFYECLRKQCANEKIGIKPNSIITIVSRHDRRGFLILGCRLKKDGKFAYSYVNYLGCNVSAIGAGKLFDTLDEANEMLASCERRRPNMAFAIVDISDEYANLSCVERVI